MVDVIMETSQQRSWGSMFQWTYVGVDHNLPGNGGPDCVKFSSGSQRFVESIIFASIGLWEIYFASRRLTLPRKFRRNADDDEEWLGRRVLLVVMCLTFGTEIGFKFATGQFIWILNPCHLVSVAQIYLLTAPANRLTMAVFRLHLHLLNGATLAVIFPVVNTRLLPFETEIYYLQHLLMYVIPYYLLQHGGVYSIEPLWDFSWTILGCGTMFVYHFVPLVVISWATEVNLSNMLCPAISDPFYGPYYRFCAAAHQTFLMGIHGKGYILLVRLFLPKNHQNAAPASSSEAAGYIEERIFGAQSGAAESVVVGEKGASARKITSPPESSQVSVSARLSRGSPKHEVGENGHAKML